MRDEAREREREKRPRLSRSHKTNERIPFFSSLEGKRNAAETETKGKRSTTPFRPDGSNGEWGNVVLERCRQRCLERKGRRMTNPRFRSLLRKRSRSLVYGIGITSRLSFSLPFSIFRRSNEVQVEIKEKDKGQRKRGEENTAQIDYTSSRSSLAFFFLKRRRGRATAKPRWDRVPPPLSLLPSLLSPRFLAPSLTLHMEFSRNYRSVKDVEGEGNDLSLFNGDTLFSIARAHPTNTIHVPLCSFPFRA